MLFADMITDVVLFILCQNMALIKFCWLPPNEFQKSSLSLSLSLCHFILTDLGICGPVFASYSYGNSLNIVVFKISRQSEYQRLLA